MCKVLSGLVQVTTSGLSPACMLSSGGLRPPRAVGRRPVLDWSLGLHGLGKTQVPAFRVYPGPGYIRAPGMVASQAYGHPWLLWVIGMLVVC